jgi:hypothetical protein
MTSAYKQYNSFGYKSKENNSSKDETREAREALGSITKLVDANSRNTQQNMMNSDTDEEKSVAERTRRIWKMQGTASICTTSPDWSNKSKRVSKCLKNMAHNSIGVDVEIYTKQSRFGGLMNCGSVWTCPICTKNISRERKQELDNVLKYAREHKFTPVMMTLTAHHTKQYVLQEFFDSLMLAKKTMFQGRTWKAVKEDIVGFVLATEITWSVRNSWHPHFHILIVHKNPDADKAKAELEILREEWISNLKKCGLTASEQRGFDLMSADAVGDYVSKFGAAEALEFSNNQRSKWDYAAELASGHAKEASKSSKTVKGLNPWDILACATFKEDSTKHKLGMKKAKSLFIEYANVFVGRQQLQWSRGLKDLVGVEEKKDTEVNEDISAEFGELIRIALRISPNDWYFILRKSKRMERLGLLEFSRTGATDEQLWVYVRDVLMKGKEPDRERDEIRKLDEARYEELDEADFDNLLEDFNTAKQANEVRKAQKLDFKNNRHSSFMSDRKEYSRIHGRGSLKTYKTRRHRSEMRHALSMLENRSDFTIRDFIDARDALKAVNASPW